MKPPPDYIPARFVKSTREPPPPALDPPAEGDFGWPEVIGVICGIAIAALLVWMEIMK